MNRLFKKTLNIILALSMVVALLTRMLAEAAMPKPSAAVTYENVMAILD